MIKNNEKETLNMQMTGFDSKKFKEICNDILNEGCFKGIPVFNKTDVYFAIADELNVSDSTVKKWVSKNSNGPRDIETLEGLEKLLGVNLWNASEKYPLEKYSAVTKNAIASAYGVIEQYFAGDDYEDEDKWTQTMAEIRKFELSIPEEEYKKITDFLNENVADLVYDEETFAELYTEEYGEYCEDGSFSIADPTKFLARYFSIIMEKEEKFKNFMKENYAEALQA